MENNVKVDLSNFKKFAKLEKIPMNSNMIIIHITDTYFIEETRVNNKVDLPGFARFYSLVELIKSHPAVQKNNTPVFVLHGGDFLFPSLMSIYFNGKQMIDILNACGFDYSTIGNHDFDGGLKYFKTRMAESSFDLLCVNIKPKKNASLQILDYVICPNKKGHPFAAFIGIAGKDTLRKAKQNGFDTFPTITSLKKTINTIKEDYPWINHLIVVSHMDNKEDLNLQRWLNKNWYRSVCIFGGHDHNEVLQYDDKNPKSALIKGQSNCRTVQILGLDDNNTLKGTKQFAKNILVLNSADFSEIKPNPKIQEIVNKWEVLLEEYLNEAESDVIIRQFDANTILDATEMHLRKGSTNFGNFIADCMCEFAKSNIALINSGHFRGDRNVGNILKLSDLRRIFVLDKKNSLLKISMTGTECRQFLKHAYSEEGQGKILQVSKNTISILQNSSPKDKFSVVMLWDMLNTDDDGFATLLAKSRKTTVKKLQSKLKKYIISDSSFFDIIQKSSKNVKYDPSIRLSVKTFEDHLST